MEAFKTMKKIILKNEFQQLTILTTGATIHQWQCFKDQRNIVISNKNLSDYEQTNKGFLNQTIGRVANRIKDGRFNLNGIDYQLSKNFGGGHHGHGGPTGFYVRDFEVVKQSMTMVQLKYVSKDLEEGYPGEVTLYVTYQLEKDKFYMIYDATTTKDTIISITNHAHFNLSLEDTILNHEVKVSADRVLDIDKDLIPSGKYLDVSNTPFDLRKFITLKDVLYQPVVQKITKGLDHAYIFNHEKTIHLKYKDKNLVIKTDYPGVQIYAMNYPVTQPLLDREFKQHAGIAFEPQYEPNAINIPHFNQPILRAGQTYHHVTTYHVYED